MKLQDFCKMVVASSLESFNRDVLPKIRTVLKEEEYKAKVRLANHIQTKVIPTLQATINKVSANVDKAQKNVDRIQTITENQVGSKQVLGSSSVLNKNSLEWSDELDKVTNASNSTTNALASAMTILKNTTLAISVITALIPVIQAVLKNHHNGDNNE